MVGRGKKKTIRKAGTKDPPGQTKVNIILFLANGRKSRQDILDYSKKKLGISTARGIDKHLTDLTIEGFLVKEPNERGFEIHYHLNTEFFILKKIIKLCDSQGKLRLFMFSNVGKEVISDNFLVDLIKELIIMMETKANLVASVPLEERDMELDCFACRHTLDLPEGCTEEELKAITWSLYDKTTPAVMKDLLREYEGDPALYETIRKEVCRKAAEMQFESEFGEKALLPSLFQSFQNLIIHPDERLEITEILRCSPIALKFMSSPDKYNLISVILTSSYQDFLIYKDEEARSNRDDKEKLDSLDREVVLLANEIVNKMEKPTLLLQALRGMLVLDISEMRFIPTPWLETFLKIPQVPIEMKVDLEHGITAKFNPSGDSP